MQAKRADNLSSIYVPLRLNYGLVPVVDGLDKFLNLLTDWDRYLPPSLAQMLPVGGTTPAGSRRRRDAPRDHHPQSCVPAIAHRHEVAS
jgi:hypothetical protein